MTTPPNEPTVIEGRDRMMAWVLLSRMYQLAIELNTGLKHSAGPILAIMYREGWIDQPMRGTRANKQAVLWAAVELYRSWGYWPDGLPEPIASAFGPRS